MLIGQQIQIGISVHKKNISGIKHPHPVPNKPNAETDIANVEQHKLQEPSINVGAIHDVVHNPTGQQYIGINIQETGRVRQKLHPMQGMATHKSEKEEQTVRKIAGIPTEAIQQVEENKQQISGIMLARKQQPKKLYNAITGQISSGGQISEEQEHSSINGKKHGRKKQPIAGKQVIIEAKQQANPIQPLINIGIIKTACVIKPVIPKTRPPITRARPRGASTPVKISKAPITATNVLTSAKINPKALRNMKNRVAPNGNIEQMPVITEVHIRHAEENQLIRAPNIVNILFL